MTDCTNETLRDLLPALAHDALSGEASARVRSHVAQCAVCTAEFDIIKHSRKIFAQATPSVDIAAIVAKLPTVATGRPVLTIERSPRPRFSMPRYALAAAASLLIVATLALPTLFGTGENGAGIDLDTLPVAPTVPIAILGASTLDDLGSDELETLLAELETMEATVSAEPPDRQPITSTPEGI